MAGFIDQRTTRDMEPKTSVSSSVVDDEPPELSPLWGLTLVLGEIAERVAREQADHPSTTTPQRAVAEPQDGDA